LIYALATAYSNPELASPVLFSWGITAIAAYCLYVAVIFYCAWKLAKGTLEYYFEILGWGVAVGLAGVYSALHLLSK
jgi:hypothetical protein